jgi:hypothetical protein
MQHDLQILHLYRAWRRTPTARSEWTESRTLISHQRHGVTGRTRDRHDLSDTHHQTVQLADASHALVMLLGTDNYHSNSDREALQRLTDAATLHAARLAISTSDDVLSRQFRAAVQLDPTYLNTFESTLGYIPLQNDDPIEPSRSRYALEVRLVAQLLAYPDQVPTAAELLHDNPVIGDPVLRAVYFAVLEFTPPHADDLGSGER